MRQRLATERYPYAVAVTGTGAVFVSAWGGHTVSAFAPAANGRLRPIRQIPVARHPSALLLTPDGTHLYVASASTDEIDVVDTHADSVVARLHDATPARTGEGSTPNALALSADGTRLFVAEADNNAIAYSGRVAGYAHRSHPGRMVPHRRGCQCRRHALVVNGKGHGTGPNPETGPRSGAAA